MVIPPGHYSSTEDILQKMNELVDNEKGFKDDVKFSYDTLSRKVTIQLQNSTQIFLLAMSGIYWDFLRTKRFQTLLLLKEKRTWTMASTIFSFTVILYSHNMWETPWSLCFALFL